MAFQLPITMLLLSLLFLFLSCPAPLAAQTFCSNYNGAMYMPNNTYKSNLISLAETLIAHAVEVHSATGTAGTGLNKVYGAVLCRGDSNGSDCHKHLTEALDAAIINKSGDSHSLQNKKNVTYYYDQYQAQISFSDQDFLSSFSNKPECTISTNPNVVTDTVATQFEDLVTELMSGLADAVTSRAERYATGRVWFHETRQTVYGQMQCMQDMPYEHCVACLDGIIADRQSKISSGQLGAAILGVRCTLRYETDWQFFTDTGKMMSLLHCTIFSSL